MVPLAMATAETGGFGTAWLGTVVAINAKYKCTQTMGNSEACSMRLSARPNPQVDEARYCVTADGAGQGKQ